MEPMDFCRTPTVGPHFYESTLSTKRERLSTPHGRRDLAHPPPTPNSRSASRKTQRRSHPNRVTFSTDKNKNLIRETKYYNIHNDELTFFEQVFTIDSLLGTGSFGEVYAARCNDDNKIYAVKRLLKPYLSEADRELRLREVKYHEQLPSHPNLLSFVKAWEEREQLYIQMEFCENSLQKHIEEIHSLNENEVWNILVDMLMALNVLHSRDLLHLDVKPENIFIKIEDNDFLYKLGDFGLVIDMISENHECSFDGEGDNRYLAREVLNEQPTKAADIFSLGITILEIATDLDLPQDGPPWHDVRELNIPERFLTNLSEDLRRVIMWMMDPVPRSRPTVEELLRDSSVEIYCQRRLKRYSIVGRVKHISNRAVDDMALLYFTFFHLCTRVLLFIRDCFYESRQAARERSPILNYLKTPTTTTQTPKFSQYTNQTPLIGRRRIQNPRHLDFDFSTDEENSFPEPPQPPRDPDGLCGRRPQFGDFDDGTSDNTNNLRGENDVFETTPKRTPMERIQKLRLQLHPVAPPCFDECDDDEVERIEDDVLMHTTPERRSLESFREHTPFSTPPPSPALDDCDINEPNEEIEIISAEHEPEDQHKRKITAEFENSPKRRRYNRYESDDDGDDDVEHDDGEEHQHNEEENEEKVANYGQQEDEGADLNDVDLVNSTNDLQ